MSIVTMDQIEYEIQASSAPELPAQMVADGQARLAAADNEGLNPLGLALLIHAHLTLFRNA